MSFLPFIPISNALDAMMSLKTGLAVLIAGTYCLVSSAQDTLRLEEAIQLGLENNYSIRIARNQEEIAANSNNAGNAGFLPSLTLDGDLNFSSNNVRQEFLSGESNERNNADNNSFGLGARLSWTAFDGFEMFALKDQLKLQQDRSHTFTRSAMHDLVTRIQVAYYETVRIRQQISNILQALELDESLRGLARAKLEIGTGTELEVLQTTNRVNADSSRLLNLQDQLEIAKMGLNRLMNRDPNVQFAISEEVPDAVLPNLEELIQLAQQQNFQLRLLDYDEQIALTQIRQARSALYPTLDIFTSYNYNNSRSEAGFLLSNTSYGPQVGIALSYDLFPGRNIRKDIANAELFEQNVRLNQEDVREDVISQLSQLYQNYQALIELQDLEERNLQTAQRNINLSRRLYQSGRATNFDVREAIFESTTVQDRLSNVRFRKKVTEIRLRSISGIPLF